MPQPAHSRKNSPNLRSDESFAQGVADGLTRQIAATLKPLTTASKTRVMVILHAVITDTLDALDTTTDV